MSKLVPLWRWVSRLAGLAFLISLAYFAEARTYGRHACRVELDAGIVKQATYNYAD